MAEKFEIASIQDDAQNFDVEGLTKAQVRKKLDFICYCLLYKPYYGDDGYEEGLPLDATQASEYLRKYFPAELEAGGYTAMMPKNVKKKAENYYREFLSQNRIYLGVQLFPELLAMDLDVLRKNYNAIMNDGELHRTADFVKASKSVAEKLPGHLAPQRHTVEGFGGDMEITEEDKEKVRKSLEFTDDFEQSLLEGGTVVDEETEDES